MDQPSKNSVAMRLGAFFFVVLDAALAALNCFNAHSAILLASEGLQSANDTSVSQVQHFTGLGVPEATIVTAIVCSIHAVIGVLLICHSRHDAIGAAYVVIQFVLAIMLICIGGFIAVRIPAYRLLFEMYHGQNNNLRYHIMYYGSIAEAVYGGLWIIVPFATLAAFWAWA